MSNSSDSDFDLDLHFLPAWARKPSDVNPYTRFSGQEGPARGNRSRDNRGDQRGPRRDSDRPFRGGGGRPGPAGRGRPHSRPDDRRRDPVPSLPEVEVRLMPDEKGVDSLTRQIKMTGRAYPLFDIAQMILQKPERQQVRFIVVKKPDGSPVQPLFVCTLDDTLWLSDSDAVAHVLNRHFDTFYQTEKTPTDPPKGTYTFVAQCGMSGVILGPPNYHDYQNKLCRLHAERFSRMPFEAFKARVKIVKDEAVVKKWLDDQSWKTAYICLNVPEPLKLENREEVEAHFRQVHLPNIIKQVESHEFNGPASRSLPSPLLQRVLRQAWESQKRFPLKVVNVLSQQFASRGLQFFKVNKTITHVAVARPHFLDLDATPVSENIRRIMNHIESHPRCLRRQLLDALAPSPPRPEPQPASAPAPESTPAPQQADAGADDSQSPAPPASDAESAATQPPPPRPTPEQTAIISDLHWLIHQGHVIEFANGALETAKKPALKPRKPAPATESKVSDSAPSDAPVDATAPASETPAPIPKPAEETQSPQAGVESETQSPSPITEPAPPATEPPPEALAPNIARPSGTNN
ncbi:MAG TPA: hypothetical protein VMS21_05730 [Methylomirabilota bacterium]|nr:hypothetical protein [Methylomirabilota bacterium]